MKNIVITGSSSGIGFGLAKEFLQRGNRVMLNGRNENKLRESFNSLSKYGDKVQMFAGDICEPKSIEGLINFSQKVFGNIDIWINNAGIPQSYSNFIKLQDEEISRLININVTSLMIATKKVANAMLEQGYGKIFNMEGFGSDGRMMDKLTLYGSSKSTVHYFSKSISKEQKNSPIEIGILSPGMVRTDFIEIPENEMTDNELKQFNKVRRILAEDVDVVTKYLSEGVLKSKKKYDRINFLSGHRLFIKIIRLIIGY